jgi:hypothetical protein
MGFIENLFFLKSYTVEITPSLHLIYFENVGKTALAGVEGLGVGESEWDREPGHVQLSLKGEMRGGLCVPDS